MIGAAVAGRAAGRVARATVTTWSALGEARLARHRPAPARAQALAATMAELCAIHAVEVVVHGELPDWPCLLVANHRSYIDALAILARVPALPVARREVAAWPIVGPAAVAAGVLFVDDAGAARARLVRAIAATLASGASVLNFAEGAAVDATRRPRFHRGSFGAAMLAGVPVVPVAVAFAEPGLAWSTGVPFLPNYWRLATRHLQARVELRVGDALWPRPGDRAEDLARRAERAIGDALRG